MFGFKSRKSNRKGKTVVRRPLVEVLENRQMLSTTIFINSGTLEPITEGQPVTNNTVARVAAYNEQQQPITDLSGFTAKIDWGDGTGQTDGTIGPNVGENFFAVEGSHTYVKAGDYPITVFIQAADGTSADDSVETAGVQDAAIAATSTQIIQATVGQEFTKTLAQLTDSDPNSNVANFSA